MAQQQATGVMAMLGNKVTQALKNSKDAPPKQRGFVNLPGGLAGVAKAIGCGFYIIGKEKTNAGKWYFQAKAAVVTPTMISGQSCKRYSTTVMVNLFQEDRNGKITTQEENANKVLDFFKTFGLRKQIESGNVDLDSLAALWNKLCQTGKVFIDWKTETGKRIKEGQEPKVFENWLGLSDYKEMAGAVQTEVQDNSGDDDADNDTKSHHQGHNEGRSGPTTEPSTNGAGHGSDIDFSDLDSLVKKASNRGPGMKNAQDQLEQLAIKAGKTAEWVKKAESWEEVAEAIKTGSGDSDNTTSDTDTDGDDSDDSDNSEDSDDAPSVGDIVRFKPEGASKLVKYKVIAVSPSKKKATIADLKAPNDESKQETVKWADLVM